MMKTSDPVEKWAQAHFGVVDLDSVQWIYSIPGRVRRVGENLDPKLNGSWTPAILETGGT